MYRRIRFDFWSGLCPLEFVLQDQDCFYHDPLLYFYYYYYSFNHHPLVRWIFFFFVIVFVLIQRRLQQLPLRERQGSPH